MIVHNHWPYAVLRHPNGDGTITAVPCRILYVTEPGLIIDWPRPDGLGSHAHPEQIRWQHVHSLHIDWTEALQLADAINMARRTRTPDDASALTEQ